MIKPSQHEKIKQDFIEFSGGYTPDLAADEVLSYVMNHEFHVPGSSFEEIDAFFEQWLTDLEEGLETSMG